MRKSPELEALVRRLFNAAYVDHDVATIRNITQSPSGPDGGLRMILVADDEWFYEPNQEYMIERTRRLGTTGVQFEHIEAFEHGDVGWFAVSVILSRVDAEPSASRFTGVFVMEEGVWRSAQWHASLGVPNAEAWGVELSKDLEELLESLDDSAGASIAASTSTGTVTLMFSDVEGSTQMSESIGDSEWAQLITDHMAELRTSVENHSGTLIKTLGDGAMTAFASVTDALNCALVVQDQATKLPFEIRIGLHTGDAIHADGDYIGITVNKAARITSAAEPGEIMLSSVTAEMATGRGFAVGTERTVELKGLAGSHRLTQLVGKPEPNTRT